MYIQSLFNYSRRESQKIPIGKITMGGDSPIRIQSMANTSTDDIDASVNQAKKIIDAGADLLRFTTQGIHQAQSLSKIHDILHHEGYMTPLVADIHFNANVAEEAAKHVEKVRVNPGNYIMGRKGVNYSDEEFAAEAQKNREKFHELIKICKANNTAIRIGVNHGSLSPRMMNKYGDTPLGLVESCLEFLRFCRDENFSNIVISVKASNAVVMVDSVRMLIDRMDKEDFHFPIHLGVTEAGNGEDGRIKSAVGIGTLLSDGIGDTVRVSLSEPPENEVPVGKKLVDYISKRKGHVAIEAEVSKEFNPFVYVKRKTSSVGKIGGNHVPVVISSQDISTDPQPDFSEKSMPQMVEMTYAELDGERLNELKSNPETIILLSSNHQNPVGEMRAFFHTLLINQILCPVVIKRKYNENNIEDLQLKASADIGPLFIDGFGDGILLVNANSAISDAQVNSIAFGILQATRSRMSRTEYIACPSCGRTMFDLQSTLEKVKKSTTHLKNLKIAVMGCIVNGLGEMADADYGYVGAGKGKVSLYKGHECIEKNIPENEAVDKLLEFIDEEKNNQ